MYIFETPSNNKFHKKSSSGSRADFHNNTCIILLALL